MDDESDDKMIAHSTHVKRLKAKQDAIDRLEEQLGNVTAERDQLKSAAKDQPDYAKLERRLQRTEAERDQLREEFASFKVEASTRETLSAAGIIDPEDQALVRWRHERIDESKRPDLASYVAQDGAARGDRHLAHLFEAGAAPAASDGDPGDGLTTRPDLRAAAGLNGGQRGARRSELPGTQAGVKPSGPPKPLTFEQALRMSPAERAKPENREAVAAAFDMGGS